MYKIKRMMAVPWDRIRILFLESSRELVRAA